MWIAKSFSKYKTKTKTRRVQIIFVVWGPKKFERKCKSLKGAFKSKPSQLWTAVLKGFPRCKNVVKINKSNLNVLDQSYKVGKSTPFKTLKR